MKTYNCHQCGEDFKTILDYDDLFCDKCGNDWSEYGFHEQNPDTMKTIKEKLKPVLHKKAKFKMFADGIFTYHLTTKKLIYEINVISDDHQFYKMKVKDILELNDIEFINLVIMEYAGVVEDISWNNPEILPR
ncbi:MAG: hypothetical protein WDZ41_00150 [Candidatus Babeliales bacterium]